MDVMSIEATVESLTALRKRLEAAFRPDTASPGFPPGTSSSGHCAAVTAIVYELLGGEMISTRIESYSHWLNRLKLEGRLVDVDLTGDQFGRPPIQIGAAGELYPGTRVRTPEDLNDETLGRAMLLAKRAKLEEAVRAVEAEVGKRKAVSHD